jgi:class 3 adenylate cyclase/tetratricopeptide (TPR) repeat protein
MTDSRAPERRQLTVMYCDMVESTALSLRLDPEELAEVIQAYRGHCAEVIIGHGGTVARYVGDAILAYFGYPRAHENDPERAIRAALDLVRTKWTAPATVDLKVHLGIATGVVVVGPLADGGEDLAAIGSTPNLAARLEGLASPGTVVVSELARQLTGTLFDYRDLGRHALKGFDAPVPAWQVLGERSLGSRFHALRPNSLTPLVDRVSELGRLRALWATVNEGDGRAVLITSEPGVGKSRLAEAVAESIVEPHCLRVWYHCSPSRQTAPLAPVIRQFAVAAGFAEHDDDDAKLRKLEKLVPSDATDVPVIVALLANLLSVRTPDRYPRIDMSPQRQRSRLFDVLMRSLEAFAKRGPMLLVVEDLHWIDPTSDELIGVLLDRLSRLPILALFTARPEFRAHWDDQGRLGRMTLAPLDRDDTITMIGLVCGDRKMPETAITQIAERTDGLPLFIEDLTRDVLESAQLDGAGSGIAAPLSIPATLNDSLMSRLDRLGSAKVVAQTASVIGREFPYSLLAKVADVPEEELRDELYRLVEAGLLVDRPTAVPTYGFKHVLVRDAAYSSLLRKTQAVLHARIARALIEHFPDTAELQPELLAHHFEAAKDFDHAVDQLVRAAKLSARRSGFAEAIAQLQRAAGLLDVRPRSPERTRREMNVQRTLGAIYAEYRGFSSDECGAAYAKALELCRELGDAPEIFSVLAGLGAYAITRADFATCRALAGECLSRAAAQTSSPPFIMGHLLLGGTLFLQGELAAARGELEVALRLYDDEQASPRGKQVLYVQDQKSTGLCYLALARTIMGETDAGRAAGERGLAHSRALGGLHTINFSLCYLAAVDYIRGDMPTALHRATESLESAREQGFATWIGISQTVRGAALVRTGRGDEGLAELRAGMSAHAGTEAAAYQPFAMALLAEGLIAAGGLEEALDLLNRALEISERNGERFFVAELWRLSADVHARRGAKDEARRCLFQAIDVARRQSAKLFAQRSDHALRTVATG